MTRDTIVCDEDGFASTKLLPYGVYTVHQTKGWAGREKIKDFDVFINADMKEYKFLINNSNFESYLKVVKLDKETGKQIAYEGAAFEIYDSENHRISMQFTYPEVTTVHTFYTNSEGYLITPEKLPYGDGYKLVEVQAPYGYVLDSTPIPFSINQENSSTDTGVTVVKVKARDIAQKGIIEITKTGEVFSSVSENNGIYTPVYKNGNLANAVFQIFAAEDITTLDGTVRAEKGELVDEITTGKDGIAKSKELYLGKYTVVEKTAPTTFYNANKQYNLELTYAGQNVKVTSTALSVNNDRQKVTVSLAKIMEQDELFNLGMNNEILSVQFGIYADESIKAADGKTIPKNALITYTIKKAQALYACALYDIEKTDSDFITKYADCFEQSETDDDLRNAVFSAFGIAIDKTEFDNLMSVIKNTVIDIDLTDTDKNNLDLVKWAQFAYDNKWGYVWGSHGQVLTEKELNRLKGVFGSYVTDKEAYIREHWLGRRTADCVGLIKGYGWYNEESGTIKYGTNGMKDVTADGMYSAATEKGPINTMPNIPGLAVWHEGHIGVYVGGGYVIHAANTYDGVIKTPITSSGWTHWLKVPYINYFEEQEEMVE